MVHEENGYFTKAIKATFTARQQAPIFYDMNASIYAYSTKALREKDLVSFFNDRADAIFMKDTAVLDIDSEEDFELMEVLAGYFYGKYPEYGEVRNESRMLAQ
jgi:CMP-N,N'-diacetyllegionaminic acid synthase